MVRGAADAHLEPRPWARDGSLGPGARPRALLGHRRSERVARCCEVAVIGVALEAALCPRCSVAPTQLVRRAESWLDDVPGVYSVCACPICGLWVTTPRLQLLHLAYPDAYFRVRLDDSAWPQAREHRGDLLDVGCGVGDSLVQARSQGWRCVGIEISENAA